MKIKINNYIFNPIAQTVTFSDYSSVSLDDIVLITNVTDGTIIFNFASPTTVGVVSGNILTVQYDTSAMSTTDKLSIYLEDSNTPASDESIALLRKMVKLLEPLSVQDVNQRQKISLDSAPATVTVAVGSGTLPFVSTVSNIAGLGGVDPRYQFIDQARNAYANGIRANILNS